MERKEGERWRGGKGGRERVVAQFNNELDHKKLARFRCVGYVCTKKSVREESDGTRRKEMKGERR